MANRNTRPSGYLAITLHAHLPYVINHGTWPHGLEWLHEAAAETYLPLLRILGNLERDGVPANLNINLSPVLLEQLTHPTFMAEFPKYLSRKIVASREDEAFFIQAGEIHLAETARFWNRFFSTALEDFHALDGNIVEGFRRFQDAGMIEILTCAATHGYMPLLGTDESLRAQIRTAIATHKRHLGRSPRGIWAPECGYRPAGYWDYPVADAGNGECPAGFERIGVEQALAESGLEFFFVDTHLVEGSKRVASPYGPPAPPPIEPEALTHPERSLYHPYYVDGSYATGIRKGLHTPATVFPRDPRTGLQVWSGETGYPGDANYLDFHKKRFPGGHRYWQVTGHNIDIGEKMPYQPQQAAERIRVHASHFVSLVYEALEPSFGATSTPILAAPFDAELFGHWWFEGPQWIEAVCRTLHEHDTKIDTIQCSDYLDRHPRAGFIAMSEGSWGAEGNHQVWMNAETSWTWGHIYSAERFVREVVSDGLWRESELGRRVAQQLCRELLLLESSDWQFLITTGAARDYAEMRFNTHNQQFQDLKTVWESLRHNGQLSDRQAERLAEIEFRDSIFPEIDPDHWAVGARDTGRKPVAEAEAIGEADLPAQGQSLSAD